MQGEARLLVVYFKLASIVVLLKKLDFPEFNFFNLYYITLGAVGEVRVVALIRTTNTLLIQKTETEAFPDFGLLVLLGDFLQPRSIPPAKPEVLVFIPLAL